MHILSKQHDIDSSQQNMVIVKCYFKTQLCRVCRKQTSNYTPHKRVEEKGTT